MIRVGCGGPANPRAPRQSTTPPPLSRQSPAVNGHRGTARSRNTAAILLALRSEGKPRQADFEDLQLAQQFSAKLAGAVLIRERNRNTFGDDVRLMLQRYLTFDGAIAGHEFGLVAKQRLTIVRRDLFDQLDGLALLS